MNNSNRIIRNCLLLCGLSLAFAWFAGCTAERTHNPPGSTETISVHIDLKVPGLKITASKAMSESREAEIDYSNVQVLVFEDTGSGEIFSYAAQIAKITYSQLKLNVRRSREQERYCFVVIANADQQNIAVGTPKNEALSKFVFDCAGKWNASDTDSDLIPMWGEYGQTIVINNDLFIDITLHRALARVDVGNLFRFNNPDPSTGETYPDGDTDKESVWGLENFKISEIRVYRTLNQAFAASSSDKMNGSEVIAPNIPSTAIYNSDSGTGYDNQADADVDPLLYILPAPSDSIVREIYIPESVIIDAQSDRDNVPCLVIGGYYGAGNTTRISYYRADFATYGSNGAIIDFLPVLRNHRYVFDIRSISGHGFTTPKEALHSISVDINLQVIAWNEVPLEFYVQGNYYLGVQTRSVSLEARPLEEDTDIFYISSYQTNLNLDDSHPFEYLWSSSGGTVSAYFGVAFDYINKSITFTAKQENVSAGAVILSDRLTLRAENFELTIDVNQKAIDTAYMLDCSSVEVHGIYRANVPLNHSNYISMKVNSTTTLNGVNYEVKTIENNGIYFLAQGTFDTDGTFDGVNYVYDLVLNGFGTPQNQSGSGALLSFDVTIVSNSIIPNTCSTRITIAYSSKKILAIGANAVYIFGYMLEPNSASRAFIDASVNFGLNPGSTVIMEQNEFDNAFTIEYMTAGRGMTLEVIDYNYLVNILNTFQPDIILTGQAINYFSPSQADPRVIQTFVDFVDRGGVFLMFNEYYPSAASVNRMVEQMMGGIALSGTGSNQSIGNSQSFVLPSGAAYVDDPILNGPFGDLRGRIWGADGNEMHGFSGISTSEVIVYSTRTDGAANMFRHRTKPFFFIGDGGFISNSKRYIGDSYLGSFVYFPFAIDASYRPVPRINYTVNQNVSVYNSQLFANIITWAVNYAQNND